MVGDECCFLLICLLNLDVIVSSPDIEFSEDFGLCQSIDNIRGEQKWITVFDCNRIELSVILHEAKFSILLFDEEDWKYHR